MEVGAEVLEVVVVGQLVGDIAAQGDGRLVRPTPGHVSDGVAAAAEEHQREVVLFHELYALGVAFESEVEAAESVAAERVGAALEDDGRRLVTFHHLRNETSLNRSYETD